MKKLSKFLTYIFTICMLLLSMNTVCFADESIDLNHSGSITVNLGIKDDLEVSLYHVADVSIDGGLHYVLTNSFRNSNADLTNLGSTDLVNQLSEYVSKNAVTGTKQKVSSSGSISFNNLKPGVYLLVQTDCDNCSYQMESFLVTIPNSVNNTWIYDVDASPKVELKTLTDISVKKVWNDGNALNDRPDSITVTLYLNDDAVDEVTLSELNNWSHTWKNLAYSDGYSVKEKDMLDYQATYKRDGNTFIITNTSKLAHTGQLNWPIPVLATAGMLLFATGWYLVFIKKKED